VNRFDPEREEVGAINQIFQQGRAVGAGMEACFGQPGNQSRVINGQRWPGGVDSPPFPSPIGATAHWRRPGSETAAEERSGS
jgi:hypothetical protein